MKKILSALLFCCGSTAVMAGETPTLSISLKSGSEESIATSKILNITYQGDNMVITMDGAESRTISVDDIKTMSVVNKADGSETKVEAVSETVVDDANAIYSIGTLKFVNKDGKTIKVKK